MIEFLIFLPVLLLIAAAIVAGVVGLMMLKRGYGLWVLIPVWIAVICGAAAVEESESARDALLQMQQTQIQQPAEPAD